jgi:sodium-dependent dicarboxylate transporter 2/3/5
MQTYHQALDAADTYSPAEEQFNRRRRTAGLILGPVVFVGLLLAPLGLNERAHQVAAIMGLMVIFWVTEALPLSITALVGPILAIVMGVAPAREVLAPFADPIVFLFIGGFILAQAMFVHGLDRRIAYSALALPGVGTGPFRIMLVYTGVCAFLSMWISNTATTAMMFPIGLSIIAHLMRTAPEHREAVRQYAIALMLLTAFGSSIGGMGTPVGTPPNLIGIGMLDQMAGIRITFFSWMIIGVPMVVLLFAYLMAQFYRTAALGLPSTEGGMSLVHEELKRLGPVSAGQRNVLIAFGTTVILWLMPGVFAVAGLAETPFAEAYNAALPESVVALIGACLLFVMPVDWKSRRFTITWDEAVKIDWGIVLLYGGGLSVGALAFSTGLATALGEGITSWLPVQSTLALTILFTFAAIVVSEAASNTASANMIVPIAIAVSQAAGVSPVEPVLGATLGASMGFMMPISTPPNAIVYSSGYIPIGQMMRHGIWLDVVAFVLIVVLVMSIGGWVA